MTASPTQACHAVSPFPQNLSQWTGETGLAQLAETTVRDMWTSPAVSRNGPTASGHGDRLLAVLAGCYAAGIFAAEDIEWASEVKPLVRMLCGGRELSCAALQRFQRTHRPLLELCLSRMFYTAWRTRPVSNENGRTEVGGRELERLAAAAVEARRRIELAMQFDLALSE